MARFRLDRALTRTRRLARDEFDLVMRLGSVSLGEIRSRGADFEVAMLSLAEQSHRHVYRRGAALADRLVELPTPMPIRTDLDNERPDLKGLLLPVGTACGAQRLHDVCPGVRHS